MRPHLPPVTAAATPRNVVSDKAEILARFDSALAQDGQSIQTMKKLICILASAALLGACEQKTETVAPAAPAEKKTENNTTVVNPATTVKEKEKTNTTTNTNTTTVATPPNSSSSSTTTTTSSPSP